MLTLFPICWLILQSFLAPSPIDSPVCTSLPDGIILTSTDGGNTWQNLDQGLPDSLAVSCLWAGENEICIGATDGLYRSAALLPVQSWQHDPAAPKDIRGIFPGKEGLYVTSQWDGFYQYTSYLGQWRSMHKKLEDKNVFSVLEAASGTLIAGCESGVYRSADRGRSWKHVLAQGQIWKIVERNGVLITCSDRGIWRSTDDGSNWDRVMHELGMPFQLQYISDGLITILSGGELAGMRMPNTLYRSSDNGISWQPLDVSLPREMNSIHDLVEAGAYLFACCDAGIFRSGDHGITWQQVLRVPANKGGFFKLVVADQKVYSLFIEGC